MKLFSSITRPLKRGVLFMNAAADLPSALCLALFSNHRTFALAKKFGRLGIKMKMTGDSPIYMDFGSSDHRTIFKEIFSDNVYDLDELDFDPQVIIDCGAHIGLFSRIAYQKFPNAKFFAFEPNEENFKWLEKQCKKLCGENKIINAGVGIRDGTGFIEGDGCQGIVSINQNSILSQAIRIIDFRKWILDVVHCDKLLLKIDIEGGEFELLPHILDILPPKTIILFETHGFAGNDEDLLNCLICNEFDVRSLRSRIDNNICFSDYIAVRK